LVPEGREGRPMPISAFDLCKIGIGPSSSHTVGPMRAAAMFVAALAADGLADQVAGVRAELFGSLGATGHGHGSVKAVVLGLSGERPESVDTAAAERRVARVARTRRLRLRGGAEVTVLEDRGSRLRRRRPLTVHS